MRTLTAIAAASLLIAADQPPKAVFKSVRPAAEVTACLSAQIAEFDTPSIFPEPGGRTRITTHIMHVRRIDLTVVEGTKTAVEMRNKAKGKLLRIVQGCL